MTSVKGRAKPCEPAELCLSHLCSCMAYAPLPVIQGWLCSTQHTLRACAGPMLVLLATNTYESMDMSKSGRVFVQLYATSSSSFFCLGMYINQCGPLPRLCNDCKE